MQIGAVANDVGLSASAIRYYERRGVIAPVARVAGRREFDAQTILTLRFVKTTQAAGFTLVEIQHLLAMGFGTTRRQGDWRAFLRTKRAALRRQIKEAQRMDDLAAQFETCTCTSLAQCMSVGE